MSKMEELEERISQLTEVVEDRTKTMSDKELMSLFCQAMYALGFYIDKENCIKWLELAHKLEEDI